MQDVLWQRLRAGDKAALEAIYREQVAALLQYGLRLAADSSLVEDAVHDLFITLWQNRAGLGATDSVRRYLLVALRRLLIKRLRERQKYQSDEAVDQQPFTAELAIDEIIAATELSAEQSRRLQAALQSLSSRQREAIFLRYYEDQPYEAICEIMDISYQSARNLVAGGIRNLRAVMGLLLLLTCWYIIRAAGK